MLLARLLLLSATACLLLPACNSNNQEPTPTAPPAQATLSRSFYFAADNYMRVAEYEAWAMKSEAQLSPTTLTLTLHSQPVAEQVELVVDRAALSAGYVGQYSLRSSTAPQAPTDFRYTYFLPQGFTTKPMIYRSADYPVQSTLHITSYDAKLKLLSGTFEVLLASAPDPYDASGTSSRSCNAAIKGTFANVPLAE